MTSYLEMIDRAMGEPATSKQDTKETKKGSLLKEQPKHGRQADYDPFADLPPNDPAYRGEWQRWFNPLVQHKAGDRSTLHRGSPCAGPG